MSQEMKIITRSDLYILLSSPELFALDSHRNLGNEEATHNIQILTINQTTVVKRLNNPIASVQYQREMIREVTNQIGKLKILKKNATVLPLLKSFKSVSK
jgi:hypothetical protein